MRADCSACKAFRRERETQVHTGEGDLGDLLTRVALHEATAHRRSPPPRRCPTHPEVEGDLVTVNTTGKQLVPVRPWGIGRLAPYPVTVKQPFTTITIDPTTQTGVFYDHLSQVVEMGKHGTSSGTETSTSTNLDSQPDQGHDQDTQKD